MTITSNTQAILLLTAHFSKTGDEAAKPLTPKEWGRFAEWLKAQSLRPEQLLTGRLADLLDGWRDKAVSADRLEALLERGSALALSMDKWQRSGLWVMTRSDADYPRRLKQRLGADSPAVLFGCGNRILLNSGGLAVIGSRNADGMALDYSRKLGALAARNGYSIVSGGARGVDETAMLGALEVEGTAVGMLADSLLRTCSSAKYRPHLMQNNLALVSPFHPEAGFNTGNAMQRNKYIYCLADAALAVHSGLNGGTWSGALENLKKQWVPLWVKQTEDTAAGNGALVEKGAAWISGNIDEINLAALFESAIPDARPSGDLSSQDQTDEVKKYTVLLAETPSQHVKEATPPNDDTDSAQHPRLVASANAIPVESSPPLWEIDLYDLFLAKLQKLCEATPRTPDELADAFQIHKAQLNAWLKQAVADRKLKKLSKPVRYQWMADKQALLSLE